MKMDYGIDARAYAERLMPTYRALLDLPPGPCSKGMAALRRVGQIAVDAALSGEDLPDFYVNAAVMEPELGKVISDKFPGFARAFYELFREASEKTTHVCHAFESVMAEVVKMHGSDPEEYRRRVRDPGIDEHTAGFMRSQDSLLS
jgi:hypothetical protein